MKESKKQKEKKQKQKNEYQEECDEYIIIEEYGLTNMQEQVNDAIEEGYSPHGNLIVNIDPIEKVFVYTQAMIYRPVLVFNPRSEQIAEIKGGFNSDSI